MNTKSLLTRIAVPVLGLGLLGGLGATLAGPASAATRPAGTVTANTHLNNHPDTTSVSGSATISSDNGPVWAYDNATEKFTITPGSAPDTYLVSIDYVGSFHGFANPRNAGEMVALGLTTPAPGDALDSAGSVKGTIAYDVTVAPGQLPDPAALPGQSPSDAHLGDNIRTLFDGHVVSISQASTGYTFTYHQVAGADYTQTG
jgi:hypothetical protein